MLRHFANMGLREIAAAPVWYRDLLFDAGRDYMGIDREAATPSRGPSSAILTPHPDAVRRRERGAEWAAA